MTKKQLINFSKDLYSAVHADTSLDSDSFCRMEAAAFEFRATINELVSGVVTQSKANENLTCVREPGRRLH